MTVRRTYSGAASWAAPSAIAAATMAGLIAALLLEGDLGKGAACLALAAPVGAAAWALVLKKR